jgi:hypothetical protein
VARPGKAPTIHTDDDTITFVMAIAIRDIESADLVVRCQRDGAILVSIRKSRNRTETP